MALKIAPSAPSSSDLPLFSSNITNPPIFKSISIPNQSWVKVLDTKNRGFLNKEDLFFGVYACGFEPTKDEMEPCINEIESSSLQVNPHKNVVRNVTKATPEIDRLFNSNHISLDEGSRKIHQFSAYGVPFHPTGFKPLKPNKYFWFRLLQLMFAPFTGINFFIPSYTDREKGVYKLIRNLIGVFGTVCLICSTVYIVLCMNYDLEANNMKLGLTHILMVVLLSWAPQARREMMQFSMKGFHYKHKYCLSRFMLKYAEFVGVDGERVNCHEVLATLLKRTSNTRWFKGKILQIPEHQQAHSVLNEKAGEGGPQHLMNLLRSPTPMAKNPNTPKKRPTATGPNARAKLQRNSTLAEMMVGMKEEKTALNEKYNIMNCKTRNIAPLLAATYRCLLPTMLALAFEKPTIFGKVQALDAVASGLLIVLLFLATNFTVLILINDALDGTKSSRELVDL
jgi:hypothetical protein